MLRSTNAIRDATAGLIVRQLDVRNWILVEPVKASVETNLDAARTSASATMILAVQSPAIVELIQLFPATLAN
jgi:hypothetical protein